MNGEVRLGNDQRGHQKKGGRRKIPGHAQFATLKLRASRYGDGETLHVDVCSDIDLFEATPVEPPGAPGAHRASGAMQVPVYATLTDEQAARVARVVRGVLAKSGNLVIG